MVKLRFAPSPTGYLHIGGARTALFNWMYARMQNAKFVLRIEDTDLGRSKKEFEEEILASMKWLGLDWDDIYYQSERFDLYREHAQRLLDEGKAYKDGEAILLKMPKEEIKIYDIIRGEITFDTSNFTVRNEDGSPKLNEAGEPVLKDEVLIKSDGSPAYSFCCVVDDALMEISPVVRGEDHISNTPKQIIIYQALGFKIPKFAHLPLIMGEDGSRLSKRNGSVAVSDYQRQGYLPEALINYLMLLGWSPGENQEIITMKSAIKKFSIKKVNKAAAVFSIEKLNWVNNQYIKNMSVEDLVERLKPLLEEKKYINSDFDRQILKNIVNLFKGRLPTLNHFLDWAKFAFFEDVDIDEELKEKLFKQGRSKEFTLLSKKLEEENSFNAASTEKIFKQVVEELGLKSSELILPVRIALTGKDIGPSLFEIMEILGREKTIRRLSQIKP
jgi:glutamyl-tRNA synthetase